MQKKMQKYQNLQVFPQDTFQLYQVNLFIDLSQEISEACC
jgi:hypothetical protein